MKQSEVTVQQFAQWSFERDLKVGCFDDPEDYPVKPATWKDLTEKEKASYVSEAEYYINEHSKDDWPVDIMERLDG